MLIAPYLTGIAILLAIANLSATLSQHRRHIATLCADIFDLAFIAGAMDETPVRRSFP